jgi:hypothetical protein
MTVASLLATADDNIEKAKEDLTFLRLYVARGEAIPEERVDEFRARLSEVIACFGLAMRSADIKRRRRVQ